MPPAVCLVTDSREPSGVGEHMLALATALREHVRVSFACPPSPTGRLYLERAAGAGFATLALDWSVPDAGRRFAEWLSAGPVDICHVHAGIGWEGIDPVLAARRAGVPVVVRTEHLPHLLTDATDRARHAEGLRQVDRIVCVSNAARDSFVAAGIAPDAITVIRNGIPVRATRREALDRERIRAVLGLAAGARMVLTVARYTPQKAYGVLLEAVSAVLASESRAHFIWVGTGPLEEEMRAAVRRRGLDGRIMLLGHRDDVADLMGAADLFVLPSRFEGLPLAVLEAMAAGLPVVATRIGGTAEAVEDGTTGLLVAPDDPAALASALADVLAHPRRAAEFGENGRRRVEQSFSAERMARRTFALYGELLARPRACGRSEAGRDPHVVPAAGVRS